MSFRTCKRIEHTVSDLIQSCYVFRITALHTVCSKIPEKVLNSIKCKGAAKLAVCVFSETKKIRQEFLGAEM